jgi:hypothetical protein
MSKTPEIDTHTLTENHLEDLRDLLRHMESHLAFTSRGLQLHPDETKRLLEKTVKAIERLDAI